MMSVVFIDMVSILKLILFIHSSPQAFKVGRLKALINYLDGNLRQFELRRCSICNIAEKSDCESEREHCQNGERHDKPNELTDIHQTCHLLCNAHDKQGASQGIDKNEQDRCKNISQRLFASKKDACADEYWSNNSHVDGKGDHRCIACQFRGYFASQQGRQDAQEQPDAEKDNAGDNEEDRDPALWHAIRKKRRERLQIK